MGVGFQAENGAVANGGHPLTDPGHGPAMADNDHGLTQLAIDLSQQLQHLATGFGVQVTGRLVAQQQRGVAGQGSGDSHTLLLSARQLGGKEAGPVLQAHDAQRFLSVQRIAGDLHRHLHVFQGRQGRHQIEELKNKAHVVAAIERQLPVAGASQVLAFKEKFALGRAVHAADHVEQGAFARAAGSDDDQQFAGLDVKIHLAQGKNLRGTAAVNLAELARRQKGHSQDFTTVREGPCLTWIIAGGGAEVYPEITMRRTLIMGAAGRDFHNFNVYYRHNAGYRVVAFTAAQIPGIEDRIYPAALAGPLYPEGIPIYPESELPRLLADLNIEEVVFAYSDVTHEAVMHKASQCLAAGADFRLLGPRSTALKSRRPVVAVSGTRTGVGKSHTTREIVSLLKARGLRVAVVRHPMPYGDLEAQAVQRFDTLADLDRHHCTLEEREEYAPHLENGNLVLAGVDYARILELAEESADVILWDGGNNDQPFYVPDLHFTVADPHRAGDETLYHPGEANLRSADVVVISKVDSAAPAKVSQLRRTIAAVNPRAAIVEAALHVQIPGEPDLLDKKVVVVEDGPTLTHGGRSYGAGFLAARLHGCRIIDPRPYFTGSFRELLHAYPHLGRVVPAMGYSAEQRSELEDILNSVPAQAVLVGTPVDLGSLLSLKLPHHRVTYQLEQMQGPPLEQLLDSIPERVANVSSMAVSGGP